MPGVLRVTQVSFLPHKFILLLVLVISSTHSAHLMGKLGHIFINHEFQNMIRDIILYL